MNIHQYDVIVVGAGFSGAVMAERFASQLNKKVLVIDERTHIAGNCYDKLDSNGVRIHQYGPHLFHTNKKYVWDYLSEFTEWYNYQHKVVANIDGHNIPVPFNLNSLEASFPRPISVELESLLLATYGDGAKIPILELRQSEHLQLQKLADYIYQKLFVNYTCKQWGCTPEEISPEVTARVPVLLSRDDRYFHDEYQAIPKRGYTQLIQNMLKHSNITIKTQVGFKDILNIAGKLFTDNQGREYSGIVVYTGMLDELFAYRYGELSYRSLQFKFEQHDVSTYQSHTTVNYPNDQEFTRITEFKHILGQYELKSTTIVKEYPQDYDKDNPEKNIPYYPVFTDEQTAMHKLYMTEAEALPHLIVLGRLAEYKYFNMDDAVGNALEKFELVAK